MFYRKSLSLLIIMSFMISVIQGQETSKQSKKTNICGASFIESFSVLKTKNELRHGPYTAEIGSFNEKGQYEEGRKAGVWEYFSKGKLVQSFDFANGKFLVDSISQVIQQVSTLDDNGNILTVLEPKGIYLGGDAKMAFLISRCLRYPTKAMSYNIQGKIKLSAILTKEGKLTDLKAVSTLGGGLEEEGIRVFQLIPQDWVPVIVDGKPVNAKIELGCSFTLTTS